MTAQQWRLMTSILLLVLLAGCGDQLATYGVSGTVLLADGQPLPGATVSMESVEGSHSATAQTDAAGRFEMSTYAPGDGLPLGTYRAVVLPPASLDPDRSQPVLFDPKYSSYETSGLEFTIDGSTDVLMIRLD